jgi:uncharacterized protein (TIGR02145 family)
MKLQLAPVFYATVGAHYQNGEWHNTSTGSYAPVNLTQFCKKDFFVSAGFNSNLTLINPRYELLPFGLDFLKFYVEAPAEADLTVQTSSPNYVLKGEWKLNGGLEAKIWTGKEQEVSIGTTLVEKTVAEGNWELCGDIDSLKKVSGDNQTGQINKQLPIPLVVKVIDSFNNPVSDIDITWVTTNNSVSPSSSKTDANGEASTSWTLGNLIGQQTVIAKAFATDIEFSNSSVTFTATATAKDSLTKVSGDNQTGEINTPLTNPLVIKVIDGSNAPVSNIDIQWSATSGSVSLANSKTDVNGEAITYWTLGSSTGEQTVTVKAFSSGIEIDGSPSSFKATASDNDTLTKVSGDNQTGEINRQLGNPLVIKVIDGSNNPVPNIDIQWSTTSGSVLPTTSKTDVNGQASTNWILGSSAGEQTLTVKALSDGKEIGGSPVTFKAIVSQNQDSTFTDSRDGQAYTFRHIGTQVWMTQNLNYNAPGSGCYDNNSGNCAIYGRLYDWNSVSTVAPSGWHVPSDAEWQTLKTYLGGEGAGGPMKATTGWILPNLCATNSSGFTALPGGFRDNRGAFGYIGSNGWWWSSTELSEGVAGIIGLGSGWCVAGVGGWEELYWSSVRCLRD